MLASARLWQSERMPEYLIRTRDTHEWPGFSKVELADVFMPPGIGCVQVDGSGDFRMRYEAAEVSFSGEEVGWQVSIDSPIDTVTADRLLALLTNRVGDAHGEECEWIQIS